MSKWFDHGGDRAQFQTIVLWLLMACSVIAVMVAFFLVKQERISGLAAIGVALLGPAATALLAPLIWRVAGIGSRAVVGMMTGAGNIKRAPSYSLQESLIAAGKVAEAVESFEAHITANPADLDARLALAALARDHLRDLQRAERHFLDVRSLGPTPAQEFAVANALIDLYRITGQLGREMTELARFAERYRDTESGRGAREALNRLKRAGG